MTNDSIKLTAFAHGGGCGCKIAPGILQEIIGKPIHNSPYLLTSNSGNEDAAVWDLENGQVLVSTTDFFMPIVDNPYDFGAIAAANAMSDVYAMGAKPIFALAILGWPIEKIPAHIAAQVMQGATDKCHEAGIAIAGGHTVDNVEPLFGLAVNGIGYKSNVKRNNSIELGDVLFLTKPIGTGLITSAFKRNLMNEELYSIAVNEMKKLNAIGTQLSIIQEVNAMTDVTGFGLLGHALEMCEGSRFSIEFNLSKIPLLPGVENCIKSFIYPDMTMKNFNTYKESVAELSAAELLILCDPQTSGGLMFSVRADKENEIKELLSINKLYAEVIGRVIPAAHNRIVLTEKFTV